MVQQLKALPGGQDKRVEGLFRMTFLTDNELMSGVHLVAARDARLNANFFAPGATSINFFSAYLGVVIASSAIYSGNHTVPIDIDGPLFPSFLNIGFHTNGGTTRSDLNRMVITDAATL